MNLYCDYSSFEMEMFRADLDLNLKCRTGFKYSDFQSTFTQVLDNHAPIKKKILWFNNSSVFPCLNSLKFGACYITAQ